MSKLANLRKKLKNKKGFTLMEMLIVVAIIVILLAIAIPAFNNALTKSKVAADEANVRSWYAECMLNEMTKTGTASTLPATGTASYSANGGPALQATDAEVDVVNNSSAETFKVTYTAGSNNEYTMTFGNS